MMASFGVVFAFVWTLGIRAAGYWSAAYLCVAGGFAVPAGFALLPTPLWGFVADLLFASGFLLFSQALLERWRPNWLLRARIAIWALSMLRTEEHTSELPSPMRISFAVFCLKKKN